MEKKNCSEKIRIFLCSGKRKIDMDDPEMIASYFTTQDVVVDKFARTNIQAYSKY